MKRIVLSKSAATDIDDIWSYLASESGSIARAEVVVAGIESSILQLVKNPEIGRRCPSVDPMGRCLVCGQYLIYYRTLARRIVVTRVLHGKRNQEKAWRE
ncbi:MAG: type II toxin-antitoxin system RelE/ParE family toxin [Acidobacteria bacterium]|nr:type II toxin-antitoxin system RelE/ParE family toxin [Acidobacteriota bacterium]